MRLIGVLAYAAVIVGIVLLGMQRSETGRQIDRPPPDLPESLVSDVLRTAASGRYVVVMRDGSCGSPFRTALNYLHRMDGVDLAIVTGTKEYGAFRMLEGRKGVPVVASDDLLARVLPFGDLILIERPATGPEVFSTPVDPLVYQFQRASTAVLVRALDEIFRVGTPSEKRPGAIQQNLQPVSASNGVSRLRPKAT